MSFQCNMTSGPNTSRASSATVHDVKAIVFPSISGWDTSSIAVTGMTSFANETADNSFLWFSEHIKRAEGNQLSFVLRTPFLLLNAELFIVRDECHSDNSTYASLRSQISTARLTCKSGLSIFFIFFFKHNHKAEGNQLSFVPQIHFPPLNAEPFVISDECLPDHPTYASLRS